MIYILIMFGLLILGGAISTIGSNSFNHGLENVGFFLMFLAIIMLVRLLFLGVLFK